MCPGGGIGRHKGLKIPRRKLRAGSSPAPGTTIRKFFMQLKKTLLKSNRLTKQIIVATSDFLLFIFSLWTTLSISLSALYTPPNLQEGLSLFLSPVLGVLIFYLSGIYRSVVRYINLVGILVIVRTLGILAVLDLCLFTFFGNLHIFIRINQELPSVVWIFNCY